MKIFTNPFERRIRQRIALFAMALGSCVFVFFQGFSVQPALAATAPYLAQVSTGAVTVAPGSSISITLKFKNIGTKTWIRGKSATAVYVYGASSIFGHPTWLKDDLPALIDQSQVKPGQMASATFVVQAPNVPGVYVERFLLSSGVGAWIKGSVVPVTFTVATPQPVQVAVAKPAADTPITPASAPSDSVVPSSSLYKGELVSRGGIEWQAQPGERISADITFKNTGTVTWKRDGAQFLSLYTWSPKYRKSAFKDVSWITDIDTAKLKDVEVKPGQTGMIHLVMTAPQASGSYQESFQLALENAAWIDGGSVTLPIRVGVSTELAATSKPDVGSPASVGSVTSSSVGTYSSVLLLTSNKEVKIAGSERLLITHGFKNEGTATWQNRALKLVSVAPALGAYSNVYDSSWLTTDKATETSGTTAPGEIGFLSYTLKAPAKSGSYQVIFQLMANGQDVDGGEVTIPVTVTSDGLVDSTPIPVPSAPITPNATQPLNGDESSLPNEPLIRVGLFKTTDDTLIVRAVQTAMIVTQNGTTVCTVPQGQAVTDVYDRVNRVYKLSGSGCTGQSSGWYVFVATDGVSPLEITDYSRPVSWLPGANDNTFRAKLELRYTPATDSVWVINELLIESYLVGIAETSNVSPLEYQKALLTAARTYAMYHVNRGTKHANEYYIVDAHLDQVYRGYGQEARSPNIVDGVRLTRGQIVTYNGALAITPYFSRSDGRTRNWNEVWGGSGFPWLVSVPVPYDVGQTLWGHGVGLSARGALYMASKDNATYDAILTHFYQGTELRRAYK